jgi:hypothetical protein
VQRREGEGKAEFERQQKAYDAEQKKREELTIEARVPPGLFFLRWHWRCRPGLSSRRCPGFPPRAARQRRSATARPLKPTFASLNFAPH